MDKKLEIERRPLKLLHSKVELGFWDYDFSVIHYPTSYITKLMLEANKLGLEGKKVTVVEIIENFATNRKYIDFIEEVKLATPQEGE